MTLDLTDAQTDRICNRLLREHAAFLINKTDPGVLAPVLRPVLEIVATIVSVYTGGRLSAQAWLERYAQSVFNLVLVPDGLRGVDRVLVVAHECTHVAQFFAQGWNGAAADKMHQPMPVAYALDRPSAAFFEGGAYAGNAEQLILAFGHDRDQVAAWLRGIRDDILPNYGLSAAQCADAAAIVDAHATSVFAGAAPAAKATRILLDELRAMGLRP